MIKNFGLPEILVILGICLCALVIIAATLTIIILVVKKNRKQPASISPNKEDL
jgi:hypothetical protein